MKLNKKLLLIGPSKNSVHIKNYYELVKDFFSEIHIISNDKIEYCQHHVLDFSLKNPFKIINSVSEIKGIIKKYKPDFIHVHQANSYAFISHLANFNNTPLILTAWGSDVLLLPKRSWLMKKMVQFNLKKATVITADAKFMLSAIKELSNKNGILFNFGIDLINEANLPKKEQVIYSNRFHEPIYQINKIIEAFSKFIVLHPNWKLIVAGNGSETNNLEILAKNTLPINSYEFVGYLSKDKNESYYLTSKIWCSVPKSDGTAISLLEAMAYGCIPVVSDLPANKEWIEDGLNGFIAKGEIEDSFEKATGINIENVQQLNNKIIKERATKEVNQKIIFKLFQSINT